MMSSTWAKGSRRVEHGLQGVAFGQFPFFGGNAAGQLFELIAAGQFVFENDELLFQFGGDFHHR